jgi:hypothetical protein
MTAATAGRKSLIEIIGNLPDSAVEKLASYASFLQSEYTTKNNDGFF